MTDRKRLSPGDLVLGMGDAAHDLKLRSGVIVAVKHGGEREHHFGCEYRLLVLWSDPVAVLVEECDCGVLVPMDLGL